MPAQRMPAEWEPHRATWLCWPHNPETWPGYHAEACAEFEHFATTLAEHEPVHLLVADSDQRRAVERRMPKSIRTHVVESDDSWLRDIGPSFVQAGSELVAIDWVFNAWGERYSPWTRDDAVAGQVAELAGVKTLRQSLVLEG